MKKNTIIYKHSSVVNKGLPKLPTPSQLEYGELAINYAADHETLSLRNNADEIVTLKTDNYNNDHYLRIENEDITTFRTVSDYEKAINSGTISAPNISYIRETKEKKYMPLNEIEIDEPEESENTYNQLKIKYVITQEYLDELDRSGNFTDKICLMMAPPDDLRYLFGEDNEILTLSTTLSSFILDGVEKINDFAYVPEGYDWGGGAMDNATVMALFINRSDVHVGQELNAVITLTEDKMNHYCSYDWVYATYLFYRCPIDTIETCTLFYTKYRDINTNNYTGVFNLPALNIKFRGNLSNYGFIYTFSPEVYRFILGNTEDWEQIVESSYGNNVSTLTVYLPYLNKTYGKLGDVWDGKTFTAGANGCTLWGYFNYVRQRSNSNPKLQVIGY
jgi:hypothetical protein